MTLMTLDTARTTLQDSVAHVGTGTYDEDDLDIAILAACRHFINATNCYTLTETWTIAAGDGSVATSAITGLTTPWSPSMYLHSYNSSGSGFIYMRLLDESAWMDLMSVTATAVASTNITRIMFPNETEMYYHPANSDSFTMRVTRRGGFDFTIGHETPASVSIPVPENFIYDVLWYGAKHYLHKGAPGHPDADNVRQDWLRVIEMGKEHYKVGMPSSRSRDVRPRNRRGGK